MDEHDNDTTHISTQWIYRSAKTVWSIVNTSGIGTKSPIALYLWLANRLAISFIIYRKKTLVLLKFKILILQFSINSWRKNSFFFNSESVDREGFTKKPFK